MLFSYCYNELDIFELHYDEGSDRDGKHIYHIQIFTFPWYEFVGFFSF